MQLVRIGVNVSRWLTIFHFFASLTTVALVYVSTPLFNNDCICFNFTFAFELGTISGEKCFT